jgi:hypothetical protein
MARLTRTSTAHRKNDDGARRERSAMKMFLLVVWQCRGFWRKRMQLVKIAD